MPNIITDTVKDSSIQKFGSVRQLTRTGLIEGVPTSVGGGGSGDSAMLLNAEAALAAAGYINSVPHPNDATLLLQTIRVEPASNDCFLFTLIYTSATGGVTTSYILTDETSMQRAYATQLPDGTPFTVKYVDGTNPSIVFGPDIASVPVQVPIRVVSVRGTYNVGSGSPPDYASKAGYVNVDAWKGLPPAYWMVAGGRTTTSKYDGIYNFEAVAISQNIRSWSEYQILKNPLTGHFIPVPDVAMVQLALLPYSPQSARTPVVGDKGIIRVDFYPTTNFAALFGFH